jgi:hypothetical protein
MSVLTVVLGGLASTVLAALGAHGSGWGGASAAGRGVLEESLAVVAGSMLGAFVAVAVSRVLERGVEGISAIAVGSRMALGFSCALQLLRLLGRMGLSLDGSMALPLFLLFGLGGAFLGANRIRDAE